MSKLSSPAARSSSNLSIASKERRPRCIRLSGMISRSHLAMALVLVSWSRAALAAPTLGAETPLDLPAPTAQAAVGPAVVWDGTQFVAAFATNAAVPSSVGVVRISGAGALLDPFGVEIAFNSAHVGVAAGAGIALVATSGYTTSTSPAAVVRLASNGPVVDATPIVLPGSTGATSLAVSFDGTNFLVAATAASSTLAWRVTPAGTVLDTTPLSIANTALVASGFDGISHVVLTGAGGPYAAYAVTRVSPGGAVASAGTISLGTNQPPAVAMACDRATGCVVLWTADETTFNSSQFVVGSLAVGSTTSKMLSTSSTSGSDFSPPAIAWDGSHYVAVWPIGGQAMAVHLDTTGTPVEPAPIAIGPEGVPAATGVAAGPGSVLSVWQGSFDVAGILAPASLAGTDGGTFPVSLGPMTEEAASAASNGDGYAVAITTRSPPGAEPIVFSRVSAQGSPLDAPPLSLGGGADPEVASAGGAYLVTWQTNGGISGALLPATGAPGTPFSIVQHRGGGYGIVDNHLEAATASQYLVGWLVQQQDDAGVVDQLAEVARVGTDGTVMDPNGLVLPGTESTGFGVASDGVNYLAVVANEIGLFAVPLQSSSGTVGAPVQIASPVGQPDIDHGIVVAYSGGRYLTVWTTISAPSSSAAFLDASGTVLSPGVFPLPQPCAGSLVALSGGFYLACDVPQDVPPPGGTYELANLDGFAISSSGVVSPADVLTTLVGINNAGYSSAGPVLAMRDGADGLLVYNRMNATVAVPAFRVVTRTVAFGLDAGAADDSDIDGSNGAAAVDGSVVQDAAGTSDATMSADVEGTDAEASLDATDATTHDAAEVDAAGREDSTPEADAAKPPGGGGTAGSGGGGGGCAVVVGQVPTGGRLWALLTGVVVGRRRRASREGPRRYDGFRA
jgi:hypothetical protein